jgi:hypothetical protein
MKFTWMIHTSFANMRLFFPQSLHHLNTILPKLSKKLYTNVVKFPASAMEHITSGTRILQTNYSNASIELFLTET